jgi:hypothetical protein
MTAIILDFEIAREGMAAMVMLRTDIAPLKNVPS